MAPNIRGQRGLPSSSSWCQGLPTNAGIASPSCVTLLGQEGPPGLFSGGNQGTECLYTAAEQMLMGR